MTPDALHVLCRRSSALVAAAMLAAFAVPAAAVPRLAPGAGNGTVRAFLVGIDQYDNVRRLKGSVNDAEDLRTALAGVGVTEVRVLENAKATRAAFMAGMGALLHDSRAGDLAILAYSGHGATVPEYPEFKGIETGGHTEEYIMVDYDQSGPGSAEIIANKEMKAWLSRFDKKGVDVLVVSDSCFGGGMVRGPVDPRAPQPSLRYLRDAASPPGQSHFVPMPMSAAELRTDVADLSHVTFLAGADALTPVPEVFIPASPTYRGALSYVMARAIEGKARRQGSEATTRGMLFAYARQQIQNYSDDQRIASLPSPSAQDSSVLDRPVFRLVDTAAPTAPAGAATGCGVKLAVLGGDGIQASDLGVPRVPYRIVADRNLSDLVWDPKARDVLQTSGDIVASGVGPGGLAGIIDRTSAIACIKTITDPRPQTLTLDGGVRRYTPGDVPVIRAGGIGGRNLVVFNIASTGVLQLLFAGAPEGQSDAWTYRPTVVEPFGADYLVALTSSVRLTTFERFLNDHDNRLPPAASLLDEQLRLALTEDPTLRIGAVALYTAEK